MPADMAFISEEFWRGTGIGNPTPADVAFINKEFWRGYMTGPRSIAAD
jgi:hypothetical protein